MNVHRELFELSIYVRQKFINVIDSATVDELKQDGSLKYLLQYACDHCGISSQRIGEIMEASYATISRWKSGKATPHPQYRIEVIRKLRDAIESDMQDLKKP